MQLKREKSRANQRHFKEIELEMETWKPENLVQRWGAFILSLIKYLKECSKRSFRIKKNMIVSMESSLFKGVISVAQTRVPFANLTCTKPCLDRTNRSLCLYTSNYAAVSREG